MLTDREEVVAAIADVSDAVRNLIPASDAVLGPVARTFCALAILRQQISAPPRHVLEIRRSHTSRASEGLARNVADRVQLTATTS